MSLYIEFEPHSYYMGFAIKKWDTTGLSPEDTEQMVAWSAYTDNGNTYRVDEIHADTLKDLKLGIKDYHRREQERTARLYRSE